jgi:hypothetical protein
MVLFGMQSRTIGPHLAAMHRILRTHQAMWVASTLPLRWRASCLTCRHGARPQQPPSYASAWSYLTHER